MAHTSYVALCDHYRVPNLDDWRILNGFFSEPFWTWVFGSQNGHRIPGTLLLLAADYTFFGGHMHLPVAVGVGCTWAAFAVVALVLRSLPDVDMRRTLLAFAGAALFWAAACHDLPWGTNQGSEQGTLLVCAAVAALAGMCGRRAAGHPSAGLLVLAVLAAVGASFSHGMGLAVWAGIVGVALVARAPWRVTIGLVLVAVVTLTLYGVGLETGYKSPGAYYLSLVRMHGVPLLSFVAAFVGIAPNLVVGGLLRAYPAGFPAVGITAGALGLVALAGWSLWLLVRRAPCSVPELFAVGLMAFAVAGGALTALNRLPWGMSAMERWTIWSALFWIGAVWMIGLHAAVAGRQRLFAAALMAVALCGVPALRRARLYQQAQAEGLRQHAHLLVLGVQWDGRIVLSPFDHDSTTIYALAERFRRARRSVFADPMATLPGARLADRFTIVPAARCRGSVLRAERIPNRGEPAVQLMGYGWDDGAGTRPQEVVVTDGDGRIRGLGAPVLAIHPAFGIPVDRQQEFWMAFVVAPQEADRYTVYAVLRDGRSACPLAQAPGAALLGAPFVAASEPAPYLARAEAAPPESEPLAIRRSAPRCRVAGPPCQEPLKLG